MNKTFNINRFWNYFRWDFNNARNSFGLGAVIIAALPLIYYIFFEIIYRLGNGGWGLQAMGNRATCLAVASVAVMLAFPVKAYGRLTERRAGTDWILLPASSFEKWLSMMVTTCIVVPVLIFGAMFLVDLLLSAVFPATYGEAFLVRGFGDTVNFMDDMLDIMPLGVLLAAEWIISILEFTLGAVCFKKSKIAKTVLALIIAASVTGILFCAVMGKTSFTDQDLVQRFSIQGAEALATFIRRTLTIIYSVLFVLLSGALYCRIRTIKQ